MQSINTTVKYILQIHHIHLHETRLDAYSRTGQCTVSLRLHHCYHCDHYSLREDHPLHYHHYRELRGACSFDGLMMALRRQCLFLLAGVQVRWVLLLPEVEVRCRLLSGYHLSLGWFQSLAGWLTDASCCRRGWS